MKVLHLITGVYAGGGAEKMLLSTLPYLRSAEQAVCVLKGRGEIGLKLEAKGIKVFYLEMKGYFDWGVVKRYREAIKKFSPDLQVNYLIHADIFGRIFAKRAGVKKLVSYIRNRHVKPLFRLLDRLTLSAVDYLLANSPAVLDFYRREYHFPAARSAVIANGIDLSPAPEFDREKLRTELGVNEEDFVILAAARLHPQKDLSTLLRALSIIKDKGFVRPKLLLAGVGPEKEKLEELIRVLNLVDEVKFLGMRNDVADLLRIAGAFVLPSLHEGMSNALLEAMKEGCPAIVSAIPENEQLIKDKINGLVFAPGNETALAEKIMAIAASPLVAQKLAAEAELTAADYDIQKIIKQLDDFLAARLNAKKKIIWVANDRNDIYLNFFRALGEQHPELDLFLLSGEIKGEPERSEGFFRSRIFPFSGRRLLNLFFLPYRLIAKLSGKHADILNLDYYRGLNALLKRENPDLVMVNLYLQPTSWQALWYCLIHRKPLILWEEKKYLGRTRARRFLSLLQLGLAAPLFLYAKKIYCYTSDGLRFGKKYFPVLNKEKIDLLPASVDTRIFYNQRLAKEDGRLKIFITARVVPFKRYEDLFRAVKVIKEKVAFKFIVNIRGDRTSLFGAGAYKVELDHLIERLGIRDLLNFLPPAPYEKQIDNFNQNDILVLPSFNEPIGIVVPEAMACGLPVIISDSCGSKTYVTNGVNGYIFKTFDFFDLAEKIILLADAERRRHFGAAAEQTIREQFDSRLVADNFLKKIKNLL
ncbi:MAG TPA: glycosyltransferase [Candidatus Nanoarchaeia archaeon]|nr:glycosyltransferase [Candidatus Nanoarchaeia archaeon]